MMKIPDLNQKFPIPGYEKLCFLKNVIRNPNIIVGDYTYYDDFDNIENFEKNVKYHFDFVGDKLIIGKFCQIASDVRFIMNGANHLTDAISCYPFAVFGEDWKDAMKGKNYPVKGDTMIGNDVWLGVSATIMPGVHIGDGCIVASHSVVVKDMAPYTVVGGNPAKEIKRRFSPEKIERLLTLKWWDWDLDKITRNVGNLTGTDFDKLVM